jgi:hypothetical protein
MIEKLLRTYIIFIKLRKGANHTFLDKQIERAYRLFSKELSRRQRTREEDMTEKLLQTYILFVDWRTDSTFIFLDKQIERVYKLFLKELSRRQE